MEIKNIKKIILFVSFATLFSLSFYVFANVNDAANKNFLLDSDQDGLTDEEEKTYGTDPYKADTDGDGYSDGVEVKTGYDPKKPAPGDKLVEDGNNLATTNDSNNLTTKLTESLTPLLSQSAENSNKEISVDDIDGALQKTLGDNLSNEISYDSLPEYVIPEDKIIKQAYSGLSDADRKNKIKQDIIKYLQDVAYICENNAPEVIVGAENFNQIVNSMVEHLNDLDKTPPDYSFYSSMKPNLELIIDELSAINVPENMIGIHTEGVKILKEYLILGESAPDGIDDPIAKSNFMKKTNSLISVSTDYLSNSYYKISEYVLALQK